MKTIKTTRGPEEPRAQVQEMIVEELTLKMRTEGGGKEMIEDLLVEGVDKGTERWNTSKGRGQHDYRNKDQSANNQHMDHLSNMANGISTRLGSKSGNRPQSRGGFRGRGRNSWEHNEETIEAIMIIQCLKKPDLIYGLVQTCNILIRI
ncbi:uncharacterized protein LOC117115774 [Anneissia japonica]|uniref:uncharacterized protein LOC117115774 n=1 Tax=Anneissia japonica TaxID=1529436 RepID=UPI001425715A|nr:uncharacterized protein LOC117115774 [Anneissia japonica]XP_033115596.1 uncharacterized protein LOC117115774 [Anneissia japonica]